MKQRHHTPEQVIRKLAEGDRLLNEGKDLAEVCRHLEIAESTWHRWENRFGGTSDKWLIGFWWGELHRTTIEPSTRQFGFPA